MTRRTAHLGEVAPSTIVVLPIHTAGSTRSEEAAVGIWGVKEEGVDGAAESKREDGTGTMAVEEGRGGREGDEGCHLTTKLLRLLVATKIHLHTS